MVIQNVHTARANSSLNNFKDLGFYIIYIIYFIYIYI